MKRLVIPAALALALVATPARACNFGFGGFGGFSFAPSFQVQTFAFPVIQQRILLSQFGGFSSGGCFGGSGGFTTLPDTIGGYGMGFTTLPDTFGGGYGGGFSSFGAPVGFSGFGGFGGGFSGFSRFSSFDSFGFSPFAARSRFALSLNINSGGFGGGRKFGGFLGGRRGGRDSVSIRIRSRGR